MKLLLENRQIKKIGVSFSASTNLHFGLHHPTFEPSKKTYLRLKINFSKCEVQLVYQFVDTFVLVLRSSSDGNCIFLGTFTLLCLVGL